VGLGFGDVVIAELLADKGRTADLCRKFDCAIGYMDESQHPSAMRLAQALRASGKSVDVATRAEKPRQFFARAGSGAFHKAAYIGPDDLAKGSVRIKDLSTRAEEEFNFSDLLAK